MASCVHAGTGWLIYLVIVFVEWVYVCVCVRQCECMCVCVYVCVFMCVSVRVWVVCVCQREVKDGLYLHVFAFGLFQRFIQNMKHYLYLASLV